MIIFKQNYSNPHVVTRPKRGWNRDIDKKDCENLCEQIMRHCDVDGADVIGEPVWYTDTNPNTPFETKAEAIINECNIDYEDIQTHYSYRFKKFSDNGMGSRSGSFNFNDVVETAYESPIDFQITDGVLIEEQRKAIDIIIIHSCKLNIDKVKKMFNDNKISSWFIEKYQIDVLCTINEYNIT